MRICSRTKQIFNTALILTLTLSLCSCGLSGEEKAVNEYFGALKKADFARAGELLGDRNAYEQIINALKDESSYLEHTQNKAFITFFYENISGKILKREQSVFFVEISSYNADELIAYRRKKEEEFIKTNDYLNASVGERYVKLAEFEAGVYENAGETLEKRTTIVSIKVVKDANGDYIIKAGEDFFNALAGKQTVEEGQ